MKNATKLPRLKAGLKALVDAAPGYAKKDASEALTKITELQEQGVLRPGLYYIVVTDLVGSTPYATEHGNVKLKNRIEAFVKSSIRASRAGNFKTIGLFVREIGDAVLFLFQHFPDFLAWYVAFQRYLKESPESSPFLIRTIVHVGEVDLHGGNPIAVSISQTFKTEKSVPNGSIVLTEPAFHVAWPAVNGARAAFGAIGKADIPGLAKTTLYELRAKTLGELLALTKAPAKGKKPAP